jgi:ribonuclease P protein component
MPSGAGEKFPKTSRLRKRPEFQQLSRTGKTVHSPNFVVISKANNKGESRLGITVSAKVGNAVVRNRIKRVVREFFRRHRRELTAGLDILVIARKSATGSSLRLVENEIGKILLDQEKRGR